jgi:hypothetical protein
MTVETQVQVQPHGNCLVSPAVRYVLPLCLVLAFNHFFIFIRPRVMQYLLIDRRLTGPGF